MKRNLLVALGLGLVVFGPIAQAQANVICVASPVASLTDFCIDSAVIESAVLPEICVASPIAELLPAINSPPIDSTVLLDRVKELIGINSPIVESAAGEVASPIACSLSDA